MSLTWKADAHAVVHSLCVLIPGILRPHQKHRWELRPFSLRRKVHR